MNKIHYGVEIEDLVQFNIFHYSDSIQFKRAIRRGQIVFSSMILFFMALLSRTTGYWYIFLPAGILISIIYVISFRANTFKRLGKSFRKMFCEETCAEMLGYHELEILEEGIYVKGPLSEGKTKWKALTKVVQDEQYGYIYVGKLKAYVIRKSSVTQGNFDELFKIVEMKIRQENSKVQEHSPSAKS